jgi:hypothetical protein
MEPASKPAFKWWQFIAKYKARRAAYKADVMTAIRREAAAAAERRHEQLAREQEAQQIAQKRAEEAQEKRKEKLLERISSIEKTLIPLGYVFPEKRTVAPQYDRGWAYPVLNNTPYVVENNCEGGFEIRNIK